MTEIDVVNYILDQSVELKTTYYKYQELLQSIREKNYDVFIYAITNVNNSVSDYMKTSIKTLIEFKDKIYNTFNNNYHNGYIEGNNIIDTVYTLFFIILLLIILLAIIFDYKPMFIFNSINSINIITFTFFYKLLL